MLDSSGHGSFFFKLIFIAFTSSILSCTTLFVTVEQCSHFFQLLFQLYYDVHVSDFSNELTEDSELSLPFIPSNLRWREKIYSTIWVATTTTTTTLIRDIFRETQVTSTKREKDVKMLYWGDLCGALWKLGPLRHTDTRRWRRVELSFSTSLNQWWL